MIFNTIARFLVKALQRIWSYIIQVRERDQHERIPADMEMADQGETEAPGAATTAV